MGKVKVLPANLANMIAAGEVVQRPASVVKELMENAVDAGATSVNVIITDAGRTLIQVIDNGCGMNPSDAVLCFERHATSKIASQADLEQILTFGFRGEALASIAAVAEITLKTRQEGSELGTMVKTESGGTMKASDTQTPVGTNFAVRNLFYNTPARRKFLKSDTVELKHIIEEFTRVAITREDIAFTLSHNGRDLFVLKPAKSRKFRILDLMGSSVTGDVVDVSADTTLIRIEGFVGRPDTARKTLGNQMFFVNGRFFRSAYLHKAVMKAYEDLIPEGVTPSYFIFLEIDPHSVDVNIHPTKTEIKFEDDSLVFQTIYACIKETIGRNSFGGGIDFNAGEALDLPSLGTSFSEYRGIDINPSPEIDHTYNPFDPQPLSGAEPHFPQAGSDITPNYDFSSHVEPSQNYGKLFEDRTISLKTLVIKEKYIMAPCESGLMVVNIKRARERVVYERALRALAGSEHISQISLFPVQAQVGAPQVLLFEENRQVLSSLGFDIEPFGTDTVVVNGVPEGFSCEPGKVMQMIGDLLLILSEDMPALQEMLQQRIARRFATLASVSGENLTSPLEAQRLLDALFECSNPDLTAAGRRITSILSLDELDKRF